MPPPYGLTPTGTSIKRLPDILTELGDRHRADWGTGHRTDPQSFTGQVDGCYGEREASIWELFERVANARNLLNAEGADLDQLVALGGVQREGAASTVVELTPVGTPGTVIPAGSAVTLDDTGRRFVSLASTTIPDPVDFECEDTGPILAPAGSDWTIATPISGWTDVTNALDGDLGRDRQSDAALRLVYQQAIGGGGNSIEALRAALIRLSGVTEVFLWENDSDITDVNGVPAHSFECVIVGGDDDEIAAAIWAHKPAGIRAYGTTTTVSVSDSEGDAHDVSFTRPADVDIYLVLRYTPNPETNDFPADGEDQIESAALGYEGSVRVGRDFAPWHVLRLIEVPGLDFLECFCGTGPSPSLSNIIPISIRQRVSLDSSRIDVVRV